MGYNSNFDDSFYIGYYHKFSITLSKMTKKKKIECQHQYFPYEYLGLVGSTINSIEIIKGMKLKSVICLLCGEIKKMEEKK